MANFAVIDGEDVINTIVAESKAVAEEVTGKLCVEFSTEKIEIGCKYVDGVLLPKTDEPLEESE